MCDVFCGHVLKQLVGHGQGLPCASWTNTQHLDHTHNYKSLISKPIECLQSKYFSIKCLLILFGHLLKVFFKPKYL